MHNENNKLTKRPFKVYLYDKTTGGNISNELIAARMTISQLPYASVEGIYVDNILANTPEKRKEFIQMLRNGDKIGVDCIVVPSMKCLFDNIELICDTLISMDERDLMLFDIERRSFIDCADLWTQLLDAAKLIIDYENS